MPSLFHGSGTKCFVMVMTDGQAHELLGIAPVCRYCIIMYEVFSWFCKLMAEGSARLWIGTGLSATEDEATLHKQFVQVFRIS